MDNIRQNLSRSRVVLLIGIFLSTIFFLSRPFSSTHTSSRETYNYAVPLHVANQTSPKRIAIVGAGASGSAAAFFLRRAARVAEDRSGLARGSLLGEIVVIDKADYVGGRSTTVFPHSDPRIRGVELGASIFVDANRNMMKAAKYFNLTVQDPDFSEAGVGIWDGSKFLFTTSTSSGRLASWWDAFGAIRRYGPLSPYRSKQMVARLLAKFANLYDPLWLSEREAARSIEDFAERLGLGTELTMRAADEWAVNTVGVGDKWMGEIMEGSTRVNYALDMDKIHALGASVSMAAAGASAIEGGNWRVFQAMLEDSKATVRLNTEVKEIVPVKKHGAADPSFLVRTSASSIADEKPYDQVFFAAPWHLSSVSKSLETHFVEPIPQQHYVRLHVTLLTTTQPRPLASFFSLPESAIIPTTILTTNVHARNAPGKLPPKFQSLTYHGETFPGSGEWVVKIFSISRMNDHILTAIFGEEPTWLLRKIWDSYPILRPIEKYAPVEPMKGLQYLAALEPWVSTMETQTLSAREAVGRVVQDWWGLGMGECRGGNDAWDWTCKGK
ncbi:prenylcysteine oxidase / farnesylcysteine lyase, partial [Tremellales sp. Uapishka_1]